MSWTFVPPASSCMTEAFLPTARPSGALLGTAALCPAKSRRTQEVGRLERQTSEKLTGFIEEEFARRQIPLENASDLADLGRAAVDGLEQVAAIDEERADHYKRLVSSLFVLLAQVATEPAGDRSEEVPKS